MDKIIELMKTKSFPPYPLGNLTFDLDTKDITNYQPPAGVCSFLSYWLKTFPEDFESRTMRLKFKNFLEEKLLPSKQIELLNVTFMSFLDSSPLQRSLSIAVPSAMLNFQEIDLTLLASQMTFVEHDMLTKIHVEEFLNQVI